MHQYLEKCLELSSQLTQLADLDEWDKIQSVADERQQTLESYFSMEPLPDQPDIINDVIQRILESDEKLKAKISSDKNELITKSLDMKSTHYALSQYESVRQG